MSDTEMPTTSSNIITQARGDMNRELNRKHSSSSLVSLSNMNSPSTEPPILTPEEEEDEKQHVAKIMSALRYYRKYSLAKVNKTETYLNSLPKRHQKMLDKYRHHLSVLTECIDKNQVVIKKMLLDNPLCSSTVSQRDLDGHITKIRVQDMDHAQSTLKAIARDWSFEGAEERKQSYKPIIDAIEHYYNPKEYNENDVKILVPGCGLGRLTYELACRGYDVEGNEFSYFMLIASNFVLNCCPEENIYTLYPWVHHNVNNLRRADVTTGIRFPDVCPGKNKPTGALSVVAGDFLEVYTTPDVYDCVTTCFFIDCANNVIDFIETIYRIIVPGGIWVNLGPLLYHFSDVQHEDSIEPTFEDIMIIIDSVGFEVLTSKTGVRTKYCQNPNSILKSEYESLFWVCRKPLLNSSTADGDDMEETQSDNDSVFVGSRKT